MKRKSSKSLFFFIAVISILLIIVISVKVDKKPATVTTSEIMIAAVDIQNGGILDTTKAAWKKISKDELKESFIQKTDTALIQQLNNSVAKKMILKGDIINQNDLLDTHGRSSLSAVIKDGMRAVAVPYSKLANAPTIISPATSLTSFCLKEPQEIKVIILAKQSCKVSESLLLINRSETIMTLRIALLSPKALRLRLALTKQKT